MNHCLFSTCQLARYMDSFQCRYGIYGIYTTTWFLKRVGHYHFVLPRAYGASLVGLTKSMD